MVLENWEEELNCLCTLSALPDTGFGILKSHRSFMFYPDVSSPQLLI